MLNAHFCADILWIENIPVDATLQTGVLHIKDFPKQPYQGQSSISGRAASSPVRAVLVIMHHHLLQSTVL